MQCAQNETGLTECSQSTPAEVFRALLTGSGPGRAFIPPEPISVVDTDGLPLGTLGAFRRCNLQPHQIPRLVRVCFVLSEDRRFWRHRGIDSLAILRAFATNLRHGAVQQGGSTITQQLVKNLFFKDMPRWRRKVPEVVIALMLERKLPKPFILASYLNTIYFGGRTYGVAEAARSHYWS